MVALFSFLHEGDILIEQLLLGEGDAVDTCHLRTFLVATPVGGAHSRNLHSLDGCCIHEVGTTTEVCEGALRVSGDVTVLEVSNELVLVCLSLVAEELQRIGLGYILTHQRFLALHEFHHLLLDSLEVSFADDSTLGRHHIVVEASLNGRTYTELRARVQLLQRFGHQVSTGMPEGVLTLFVIPFIQNQISVRGDRAVQFHRLTIDAAC